MGGRTRASLTIILILTLNFILNNARVLQTIFDSRNCYDCVRNDFFWNGTKCLTSWQPPAAQSIRLYPYGAPLKNYKECLE